MTPERQPFAMIGVLSLGLAITCAFALTLCWLIEVIAGDPSCSGAMWQTVNP